MTRFFTLALLAALSMDHGHCQYPAKAPSFEVASITPCKPETPAGPEEHTGVVRFTAPGGRFNAKAMTLKFLLEWAYGIQPSQHSAGPGWIETDRYDIAAKAEGNPTDDQMKLMLRTLLAERFRLKLHHETKKLPVIAISLGSSAPKLYPPKDEETHALLVSPQPGPDQRIVSYRIVATRFSLTQLIDLFARHLDRVIVNKTGLDGDFDFAMDLAPDDNSPNPLDPSMLMAAMRRQLGLTLKSQDAKVDFLVIDGAEKVTAGNL